MKTNEEHNEFTEADIIETITDDAENAVSDMATSDDTDATDIDSADIDDDEDEPIDYASENVFDILNGTTSAKKAKAKKKKMNKIKKALLIIGGMIVTFVLVLAVTLLIMRITGKSSLYDKANSSGPNLLRENSTEGSTDGELVIDLENMGDVSNLEDESTSNTGDDSGNSDNSTNGNTGTNNNVHNSIIQSGSTNGNIETIVYNGQTYAYNDDIITLLILGIDKSTPVAPAEDGISGGQSDSIFLVVMNPDTMVMDIIAIPRDTISKLWIYDKDGNFVQTGEAQICLQHGYGDGMELSNQRALKAISYLMYDIPIHSVTSINMGALAMLNDAIGGVTLNSLQTFDSYGYHFEAGKSVTIKGDLAFAYLRYRDKTRHDTASERLARQKQYISLFIDKAIASIKKDIGLVTDVYDIVNDYVVTDLSIDEMVYLASESISYKFGEIVTLTGTLDTSRKYERFYLDENALQTLIIEKFYEKVN